MIRTMTAFQYATMTSPRPGFLIDDRGRCHPVRLTDHDDRVSLMTPLGEIDYDERDQLEFSDHDLDRQPDRRVLICADVGDRVAWMIGTLGTDPVVHSDHRVAFREVTADDDVQALVSDMASRWAR